MVMPVTPKGALIPRNPVKYEHSEDLEDENDELKGISSYAPPGATVRARVRRLGDNGEKEVSPVTDEYDRRINSTRLQNGKQGKSQKKYIVHVEAEVSFTGDFPSKELTIHTTTSILPGDKNSEERE